MYVYSVFDLQESEQEVNNVLVDRSILASIQQRDNPSYQFERIGYFCVDTDSSYEQVKCIIQYHV